MALLPVYVVPQRVEIFDILPNIPRLNDRPVESMHGSLALSREQRKTCTQLWARWMAQFKLRVYAQNEKIDVTSF